MFPIDFQRFLIAGCRVFGRASLPKDIRQVSYGVRKAELMGTVSENVRSLAVVSNSSIKVIEIALYLSQAGKRTCQERRISRCAGQSNRLRKNLFRLLWAVFFSRAVTGRDQLFRCVGHVSSRLSRRPHHSDCTRSRWSLG